MTRLPLLARVLLRLTDPRVREFVSGDLEESFAARLASDDARRARGWSYRQALSAVRQHPWKPHPANHVRGDGLMRTFMQDLRYGARILQCLLLLGLGAFGHSFPFRREAGHCAQCEIRRNRRPQPGRAPPYRMPEAW